jgi:hypothetical protein
MGIHQFQVEVIPKSYLGNPPLEFFSKDQMQEGLDPWRNESIPPQEFLEALRNLLPDSKHWGEVEEYESSGVWGSDLRIWWKDSALENIEFRYSPASDPWALMQKFAELVRSASYLLVEQKSGFVFEATEENLRRLLAESSASRFLQDPEGTILEGAKEQAARRENA